MNLKTYINSFPRNDRQAVIARIAKKTKLSKTTIQCYRCGLRNPTPQTAKIIEAITKKQVTREELLPNVFD